jgi:hypothetical protein
MPVARKHVAAELDLEAGLGGAPTDHAIGVDPVHRLFGQHAGPADRRAEGGLAVIADTSRVEVFVDKGLQLVVRRHLPSDRDLERDVPLDWPVLSVLDLDQLSAVWSLRLLENKNLNSPP